MISLAQAGQQIQRVAEATPAWANWTIIGGSAAASWLAPLASLVAIVWGCLQIWTWIENRRKR